MRARKLRLPPSETAGFGGLSLAELTPAWSGPFSVLRLRVAPDRHFPAIYHRRMWEFFFVLRGSGYGRVGRRRVRFTAGDFLSLKPGVLHDFHTDEGMEALVVFSPRFDPRRPDVVRARKA